MTEDVQETCKNVQQISFGVQTTVIKGIPGQLLLNKRVVTPE